MKVYLGHPFSSRKKTREWELDFEKRTGIEILNPFYDDGRDDVHNIDEGRIEKYQVKCVPLVIKDLKNIKICDYMIAIIDGELCHDDKTEIMTEDGWKLFKDLNRTEKVATLNITNMEFEWQKPTEYIEEEYNGEMINFKELSLDMVVTPNHRMLVRRYILPKQREIKKPQCNYHKLSRDWEFKNAKGMLNVKKYSWWEIPHTCDKWNGKLLRYIEIPHKKIKNYSKLKSRAKNFQYMKDNIKHIGTIKIEDIAELIGWYVTEGNINKGSICICQSKKINPYNHQKILNLFKKIGFNNVRGYGKEEKDIKVNSIELYNFLYTNCGSGSYYKYIPKWLKNQPEPILNILFDTLMKGDGHKRRKDSYKYVSYSKQLLDDVAEISIKLGYSITYCREKGRILISKKRKNIRIRTNPKVIKYKGKVYCVGVPNRVILTKRNGKTIWSGNSYGTIQEMVYAREYGKNVYSLITNGHEGHPWLRFHSTRVFTELSKLEKHLIEIHEYEKTKTKKDN